MQEGGKVKVEGFESNELSLSPGEIVWVQGIKIKPHNYKRYHN